MVLNPDDPRYADDALGYHNAEPPPRDECDYCHEAKEGVRSRRLPPPCEDEQPRLCGDCFRDVQGTWRNA